MQLARRRAALAAAYVGTFLATLDISIVNVALPTLQAALHTDIAGLQWVINAYAICLSAFMLSAGPVGDRYGHKRAWMAGVILFIVGSSLCAMARSLDVLLAGRAVQGIAGAFMIPGALPILTHAFPDPKERAQVIGGWSAFSALALILGPLLGGMLLHVAGWQAIFLINLPLGLIAVGLGSWGVSERRHPEHAALDPIGQILSIVWLGALTYGLIAAGIHGFNAVATWIALTLSLIALVVFAIVEMRVHRPLLPLALFRERSFVIANFASFMLGFSYYSSLFFFSIFLQQIQGWSPLETGWRMMPQFFLTGCISILFGRLSAAFPIRRLMVAGYGMIALSMLAMTVITAQTPYWIVGLLFGLLGIGAGLAVPATGMVVMNAAPPECSGTVSATMNALRQTGMTIGIASLGTLLSNQAIHALSKTARDHGIIDAEFIARQAVAFHVLPAKFPELSKLYSSAMEIGFHAAMLFAGLGCVIAVILLLTVKPTQYPLCKNRHAIIKRTG